MEPKQAARRPTTTERNPQSEEPAVKLIIGLGNPGPQYEDTRHNAGFLALEALATRVDAPLKKRWLRPCATAGWHGVTLVQPLTYMNRSGMVLPAIVQRRKLNPKDILVLVDNMDLPPGEVRMKSRGGDAGHNGLKSITHFLKSSEYLRLYVGIGRPAGGTSIVDHVLGVFPPAERQQVDQSIQRAVDVLVQPHESAEQLVSAMNRVRRG